MTTRNLPIGIQDFEKLRTGNCAYVDKTAWVYQLTRTETPYFLGRPRRFGKSLLLSTLRSYFEGRRDLFDGLAIADLEKDWTAYPVFHLDLNAGVFDSLDGLEDTLDSNLRDFEARWGRNPEERTPSSRLKGLIQRAAESTPEKKAVVLIDEYDKPLLQTMDDSRLHDDIRNALKGFYGVLKSADRWLRFVMLTGVTKFSQVSVFSDLNQLRDISMAEDYAEVCGITETELVRDFDAEIRALAEKQGMSRDEALDGLRRRYDGYRFAPDGERVYNPFSVLLTLQNREFDYYWFQTGTPTFLVRQVHELKLDIREFGEGVSTAKSAFTDYRVGQADPLPLLYQSGYLTIRGYDRDFNLYTLGFPNQEVECGFLDVVLAYYTRGASGRGDFAAGNFVRDLRKGDVDGFMTRLRAFFAAMPYELNDRSERHYQAMFFALFLLLGQYVSAEERSAAGRADAVVVLPDKVYVFEFKLAGGGKDLTEDALRQIDDKGYLIPYIASGKELIKVGATFDADARTIGSWKRG